MFGFHIHKYYIPKLGWGRKRAVCRICNARTTNPWWPLWKEK